MLSCTQFRGAGVGIPRTVYGGRGCYRQHNFGAVRIAGQKNGCYRAHNSDFFLRAAGCYPQHNSMYSVFHSVSKLRIRQQPRQIQLGRQNPLRVPLKKILILPVVIQRTFPAVGLLSGAQFPNCRILAAVVIDSTFLKKSTVQRTTGIVIHGTIRFFRG